jgi:hypothetical protein
MRINLHWIGHSDSLHRLIRVALIGGYVRQLPFTSQWTFRRLHACGFESRAQEKPGVSSLGSSLAARRWASEKTQLLLVDSDARLQPARTSALGVRSRIMTDSLESVESLFARGLVGRARSWSRLHFVAHIMVSLWGQQLLCLCCLCPRL